MSALKGAITAIVGAANAGAAAAFKIDRSLRFNSGDSAYLSRVPSSASNRRTWTWSGWLKRTSTGTHCIFSAQGSSNHTLFTFYSSTQKFAIIPEAGSAGATFQSNDLHRDPSAWYHFVIAFDSTQSTASDRLKVYKNGVEITWSSSSYPSQNEEWNINIAGAHNIGRSTQADSYVDGYLTDIHFIDGQALAATDFGETNAATGVWEPKEFAGEYKPANIDNWPSMTTGTPFNSDYSIGALFDGSISTYMCPAAGTSCVFTPTTPIAVSSSIRIYGIASSSNEYFKINDTVVTNVPNSAGWFTPNIGSTITSLNKFEFYTTSGSYAAIVRAIEIDGQILTTGGINSFALNFSDNSSNAALGTDSSGNNNTWTVNNLTAAANYGLTTAAQIVGTSKTFSFPITYTATLTYEFFVRITTDAAYNYMAKATGEVWNLGTSGSSLLFGNYNGGWTTFNSTGLNDSEWHFVRLTTTGSSTSLYVDGSLIATNSSGGSVSTGSQVTNTIQGTGSGAFEIAHLRITTGGTPPTTGIPSIASMNAAAGSGGTLAFYDKLDDIASSGTKTSDGGNVTITMSAATIAVDGSSTDSLIDTPTNYTAASGNNGGNYCLLNSIDKNSNVTLSNGNLEYLSAGYPSGVLGTIAVSSGKWYYEVTPTASPFSPPTIYFGFADVNSYSHPTSGYIYLRSGVYSYAPRGGYKQINGTQTATGFGSQNINTVFGIALDLDNGTLKIYADGSLLGTIATGLSGTFAPLIYADVSSSGDTLIANFGQRGSFSYTPPADHVSLCTKNLAEPVIADPSTVFDVSLWTGNGSTQTISGLNLSPNFVWYKSRSSGAYNHGLFDTVRGTTKQLFSNNEDAAGTYSGVTSFNSDGFTLGSDAGGNVSSGSYVGWVWAAGTASSDDVGDYWSAAQQPKYFAFKFPTSSGGRAVFGLTSGTGNADIYTSSDNSNWTRVQSVTLSTTDTTYDSSAQYLAVINTTNAVWGSTAYAMATSGTDLHYSNVTYPGSGASFSWSGPAYSDWDFRSSGTVIKPGSLNSSAYNTSDRWRDDVAGTPYGSQSKTRLFDGNFAQNLIANNGTSLTFSPSGFSSITSLRVYGSSYTGNANGIVINGTDYTSLFPSGGAIAGWATIPERTLTSIVWSTESSGLENGSLNAIEVDGKILIDDDATPTDVPSLASTITANPTAGFSVASYKGNLSANGTASVAHGLNKIPELIITKQRNGASRWPVQHKDLANNYILRLDNTDQAYSFNYGDLTYKSSSIFSTNYTVGMNTNGDDFIAYCFTSSEVCSVGSYIGNGSTDGPFVYTGFKPAWILYKRSDTSGNDWTILDSTRGPFNVIDEYLQASNTGAENSHTMFDFVSNGFKPRLTSAGHNASGGTYVYIAFAEHPFKIARAR